MVRKSYLAKDSHPTNKGRKKKQTVIEQSSCKISLLSMQNWLKTKVHKTLPVNDQIIIILDFLGLRFCCFYCCFTAKVAIGNTWQCGCILIQPVTNTEIGISFNVRITCILYLIFFLIWELFLKSHPTNRWLVGFGSTAHTLLTQFRKLGAEHIGVELVQAYTYGWELEASGHWAFQM